MGAVADTTSSLAPGLLLSSLDSSSCPGCGANAALHSDTYRSGRAVTLKAGPQRGTVIWTPVVSLAFTDRSDTV